MSFGVIDKIKSGLGTPGNRNKTVKEFAEKSGLVYFGFVNQHSDEHKVVRGLTVSATHHDDNYSVGTVDGYNITIVDRSDNELYKGKQMHFSWLIVTVDLHTDYRVPHFFIGANGRDMDLYHPLFSSFPNMVETNSDNLEQHGSEFNERFKLFVRPAKLADLEQILTPDVTRVMAAHLWPFSVEQHDNVLYIYSDDSDVATETLTMMLKNGLFLAQSIDSKADELEA